VAAGKFFHLQPKTIFRQTSLKLEREEPVIAAGKNTGRNVRPTVERERCFEERVNWLFIARRCQCRKHIGW